ncbi:MAG: hypothetical protein ACP5GH_03865 [Nitrososphaeria archaeon]
MFENVLGVEDYAKYPFLSESISYALRRTPNLTIDKIDSAELMGFDPKIIIDVTRRRVIAGLKTGVSPALDDVHYEISLASFIISLILIRSTDDHGIYNRFALAEARRSEGFLLKELETNPRGRDLVKVIIEKVAGISLTVGYDGFLMPLDGYLMHHVRGEPSWKLVNRWVYMGFVYVKPNELAHIFREISAGIILNRLRNMPKPSLKGSLLEILKEIEESRPRPRAQRYEGAYPPCVQFQLSQLKQGVNINHSARFLLATYFINIGWDVDSVVDLFRTAPDFNEKITRYQVEQISGRKGSGTRYLVPSCAKLLTLQLCRRDETCDNIRNPLQYGRFRRQT